MKTIRILVCGSRDWTDRKTIYRNVNMPFPEPVTVIHGACRGADWIAGDVARELGYFIEEYPADWKKHGRAAGPIRNAQMLREGKPDMVIAFHNDIDNSKGTKDMVKRARAAGIKVIIISKGEDDD